MKQIGIIGAGAAGLCALKWVLATPGLNPIVWEHTSDVGGTWIYNPNVGLDEYAYPIHSSMYERLKTNLPKEVMAFPDFPFEDEGESFIHHTKVLQYLNRYADHFSLRPLIKFKHHVENVEPVDKDDDNTAWNVEVKNLVDNSVITHKCDGIIVCNGHYSIPRTPKIENMEAFCGKQMHSHDYRHSGPFKGCNVIVLGAAASGMDISLEVSKTCNKVYLSHNLPVPIPSELPGNLIQVKGIKAAAKDGFYLLDDSFVKADFIIFCTGYEYTFPFLSSSCDIKIEENQVKCLYKHIINSTYPTMGFIGIPFQICPFPFFDVQVQFLIAVFVSRVRIPTPKEMKNNVERERSKLTYEGYPLRHYHKMGSKQWSYMQDLTASAKIAYLPSFYKIIYDIVDKRRKFSLCSYKDFNYSLHSYDENSKQIEEKHNDRVLNTSFELACLVTKQLLKLIFYHFPSVLRYFSTIVRRKLRSLFITI